MPDPALRYVTAGLASATGLTLLGLAAFGNPPAILARINAIRVPTEDVAGVTAERDALQQQRATLRQQVTDLTSQVARLETELATVQKPRAAAAPSSPADWPAPIVTPSGTLRDRLELAEICLVEAKQQEAGLLLESILFQLTFRPTPGQNIQATASMMTQALAAVAAADLEKAAFYTEMARPDL
jgi:cell division septum initiation protein DivIVA